MSTLTQTVDSILSGPISGPPLSVMREKRDKLVTVLDGLLAVPQAESRNLLASESRDFDYAKTKIDSVNERISELEEADRRSAASNEATRLQGNFGVQQWNHTGGGETYHRGSGSPSYFKDLIYAQRGDWSAAERLQRNNNEVNIETRALGNTGGAGGSGGEFAPPAWMVEDFVKLARPARVTADTFHREPLPSNVSSVNVPRVATGTTTAVQTTQNTALSQTDMTTNSLTSTVVTIGGKQVISQQLIDQSGIPFDQMVLEDLAADYAKQVGTQALIGTGTSGQLKGYLTATSTNSQTWTQASPTPSLLYSQIGKLVASFATTRYLAPDTIVMHPRRWNWLASYVDSTGRPLVSPTGAGGYNSLAQPGDNVVAGLVGSVLGLPVYVDPAIPVNLGAGTNQDVVLAYRRDDIWLWESDLRAETFTQPYADSMGVLVRLFGYLAMVPDRFASTLGQIQGTGLVTPVFAG